MSKVRKFVEGQMRRPHNDLDERRTPMWHVGYALGSAYILGRTVVLGLSAIGVAAYFIYAVWFS